MSSASDDVFIGGCTVQYLNIDDQIPGWLLVVVGALMIVASMVKAVVSVAKLGLTQVLETAGPLHTAVRRHRCCQLPRGPHVFSPVVGKVLGGLSAIPWTLQQAAKYRWTRVKPILCCQA